MRFPSVRAQVAATDLARWPSHLCKIVDPVVSNVVLQPISLQAKFVKGVQKAA
jgi:hypothetical protein